VAFAKPRVVVMLALGFSSGPAVSSDRKYVRLLAPATSRSAIGFIFWVGIAYAMKFLWAPFIDPLASLPARRAWDRGVRQCYRRLADRKRGKWWRP